MLRRLCAAVFAVACCAAAQSAGPTGWRNDLAPIGASDWNRAFAAHLLERAGFGGTPGEIDALAKLTPSAAVSRLVRFTGTDRGNLAPFDHAGVHDPAL